MSHYFFEHCSHDSQTHHLKRLFYLISFHQLLDNIIDVMKTFQYIDVINEFLILRSLVVTTLRLFIWIIYFTSSIFSSLTDFDMSLIFFVDQLWLLERVLSRRWKLCMTAFIITQRSNIIQTASNWDLLTLLTSIRTQNRIKRFIVNITYRWISLLTWFKLSIHWFNVTYKSF